MKRFISIFIICMLLFPFITVYSDGAEVIKVEAQVGFDKSYKPGYVTPIFITMENNSKDIEGEIQIEIPSEEGYGANTVTLYAIGINHPKNTVKKYVMNIPLPSSLLNVKLKVVEGKKVLLEKYVRIDRRISDNTMVVGLLSEDGDSLNYLNGFTFNNMSTNYGTKIVRLNEEIFPSSLDVMENFNMIIINGFDTSKLNDEQYQVLKKWLEQGGYLVVGTGPSGVKTLSIFKDDFITGDRGGFLKVSGKALGAAVNDDFDMPLDIMELRMKNGESVVSQDGINLIQKLDKGKGRILLLSFDMGLEPISSWKLNKYFMESIFQKNPPTVFTGPQFEKYMYSRGYDYNIENALRNIPELPLPNYSGIMIIFIIYIILVAPVSYFVLKKRDKREFMWGIVPIFSLIFASLVYLVGFGTRLTEPILNTISIFYADEESIVENKSYGGIFTPNKTNLKIEGIEDIRIKPFMRDIYYGSSNLENWDGKRVDAKYVLSPKPSLEYYDIGIWSMKTFTLERYSELKGGIKGKVSYEDSSFKGYIENNTNLDLNDCYLISANQYIELGSIKSGEKKEISSSKVQNYNDRYVLLDSIYGLRHVNRNTAKGMTKDEIEKVRSNYQKRNVVEYYFNREMQGIQGLKLIAWSDTPRDTDILVNNKKIKKFDKSMVVSDIKLNVFSGKSIELPFGYVKPIIDQQNMMKGNYDSYSNRFYGMGTVEISFNIDSSIKPEKINIYFERPPANTKQFIWNMEIKDWESRDVSNYTIEDWNLEKYIDENNTLKLKFDIDGEGMQLPQISVKGSVK